MTPSRAESAQTAEVSTEDAYGNGPMLRSITPLRGACVPAIRAVRWSTPPARWSATVFAAITGRPGDRGGFAVPDALVRAQLAIGARAAPERRSARAVRS